VETEAGIARPPGIRELPIVAGHLALDFANTVDDPLGPERWDHIPDHPNLVTWGERVGIVDVHEAAVLRRAAAADPEAAGAAVRDAVALRGALNDVFGAVVDGTPLDDGWGRLRPFVAAATARAELTAVGPHPAPTWSFVEPGALLWPVSPAPRWRGSSGASRARGCSSTGRGTGAAAGAPWRSAARTRRSAAT
jgi:hypothetical protein